ncbi:MAG: hypothetical protein DMG72_14650 [Acidobacteria bacterium]|nr:MAG: hypothetical protein DMG72_14650 [Acidobacteriota bacterium]
MYFSVHTLQAKIKSTTFVVTGRCHCTSHPGGIKAEIEALELWRQHPLFPLAAPLYVDNASRYCELQTRIYRAVFGLRPLKWSTPG